MLKEIFDVVIYAVPVIGLIIVEPDLGGAIIFCCIVFGMIFSAGINRKILIRAGDSFSITTYCLYVYVSIPKK